MKHLTIVTVSLWLGAMGFFAFVVAPGAFGSLDREAAGRLVAAILPRYYWVGVALGLLAVAGVVGRWGRADRTAIDWIPFVLLLLMLGLTLYCVLVLLPEADALQDAALAARRGAGASAEAQRFARLHRLSTLMGLAVMVAGVAVVALEAFRRAKR